MTWSDPLVEEVRRARDAYAARFNYDLRAIVRDLKEQGVPMERLSERFKLSRSMIRAIDVTDDALPRHP